MSQLTVVTDDCFSSFLELAANNNVDAFKRSIEHEPSAIDEVGLWLVRKKGSKQIVSEERTPLMVAASYGSIDVLKLIISHPEVDVNRTCGPDKCTALHCAASGGSLSAIEVIKMLLSAGADPNIEDAHGQKPVDVVVVPPKPPGTRSSLEELLTKSFSNGSVAESHPQVTLTSSPENGSPHSPPDSASSFTNSAPEKKEYLIDPSLPNIKNSMYSTDEFRMYSFKVRPCSRAYSHDWTECPFVHPGENARRRDPRKYHYSCVPCPDFRKGSCRRGDMCEYAHGVFECWLHPAQYRTRLCKDGTGCARRVCFFAHAPEELRPLYVSTGSAVPSPRSAAASATVMDMAAAMSLYPGSPMSPAFNQQPMSPTANGGPSGCGWPQPNVPALHLPGSNHHSSRLRLSLHARDVDLLNDMAYFSQPRSRPGLTPSNLEDLFSAEITSSPRFSDQASGMFSPSHKFNHHFSPKNADHPLLPFACSSPGVMSPRAVDSVSSPMSAQLSAFAQREKLRSLSSRELGSRNVSAIGSPSRTSWSNWEAPNAKVDWSMNALRRSSSFEKLNTNGDEPDLSWVQSLVKESPPEMKDKQTAEPSGEGLTKPNDDSIDHSVLGAWLEQMQLDHQLVA